MNAAKPTSARFLVSVRSPGEALIALSSGADIIDVKEPRGGALGAVKLAETSAILREVAGKRPVSATIGDCAMDDAPPRVLETARTGVDYVKIGLFGEASAAAMKALERCAASGIHMIAVMFADRAPDWQRIRALAETGFTGVMLDTANKGQGSLRAHLAPRDLAQFLSEARTHGLLAGLAGSLREADAEALLPLHPDVLGFRGALCGGGLRGETLDGARVRRMRALIPQADGMNADGMNTAAAHAVMAEEG